MTVHLLPCGLSILNNLAPPRSLGWLGSDELADIERWRDTSLADALDAPDNWADSFAVDVLPLLGRLRVYSQPNRLSAEIGSILGYAPPAPDDRIVILTSDTPSGMLAALLNAARLKRPTRVYPRPVLDARFTGTEVIKDGAGEPVHVIRIPGMLPNTTETFTTAMRGIAEAMIWAGLLHRPVPSRSDLIVHLCGGYKATLPYLAFLAEYLKGEAPRVAAFCLHEGEASNPNPRSIEVCLRTRKAEHDIAEIAVVVETEEIPVDPTLLDFAYKDVDGRAELTPLGHALAALSRYLRQR